MEILGEIKKVKARKDHQCTASESLFSSYDDDDNEIFGLLTVNEILWYNDFIKNWTIKKGEEYYRYAIVDNGEFWQCKEHPIIRRLCLKLDCFGEN